MSADRCGAKPWLTTAPAIDTDTEEDTQNLVTYMTRA